MSTRALFTFTGDGEDYHVLRTSEGHPDGEDGALDMIARATMYAWRLPRFQPDEFAAAFVVAAKLPRIMTDVQNQYIALIRGRTDGDYHEIDGQIPVKIGHPDYLEMGGGVRLLQSGPWQDIAPSVITWRYVVSCRRGVLFVATHKVWQDEDCNLVCRQLHVGPLASAIAWAAHRKTTDDAQPADLPHLRNAKGMTV